MTNAVFHTYNASHEASVRSIMAQLGWNERYVSAQLWNLKAHSQSTEADVILGQVEGDIAAFIVVQHNAWNRLSQVLGLAVAPAFRRQGLAGTLMQKAEASAQGRGQRGIYVDSPVENQAGRALYRAQGYTEAYTMPQYYAVGADGVTYLKFFNRAA